MLKKALIGLIILSIGFFIYTTYFKDNSMEYVQNNKIKSLDVKYTNGIYTLRAKEEIDDTETNTMSFNDVIVEYAKSYLKGDHAVKDELDNVTITGNVQGENPTNGWLVKGQELIYHKDLDRINSNKPVEAYNSIKKLKISGNYFESDVSFDEILLDGNVNTVTDNFELVGEKAYYKGEILELIGNVETEIKSLNKTNDKENSVVGVFPGAIYDTKKRILTATGAYQMFYKDFIINANELIYDENTDIIIARGNVTINGTNLNGTFPEAKFNMKEDKIYLKGPINAVYNELNFVGENGVYDNGKETFETIGKVVVTSGEDILNAGRVFYTKKTGIVEIFGEKEGFTYKGIGRELKGTYAKFYVDKNQIEVPGKFTFKYEASKEDKVDGTGEKLILDTVTQKGTAQKPILHQGKDNIKGNLGELDLLNGVYKLKGKVVGNYGNYIVNSEEVDYYESNGMVAINKAYTINEKVGKFKIWGNDVKFDTIKYLVTTEGKVNFSNGTMTAYGVGLSHNLQTKEGEFKKDFYGKAISSGVELTGDKVKFKEDSFVTLSQNVKGNHKDFVVTTASATYDMLKETITMPTEALINAKGKGMEGKTANGIYDVKTEKYTGNNFKGWSDKATIVSDYIYYDMVKDEAYLKNNIVIKDKTMGAEIRGKEIVYYLITDIVSSKEPLEIKRDNIFINSKSGKANLNSKTAQLDKTVLTTSNNDRISGDTLFADLLKNEFKFDGNIDGTIYSLNNEQLKGVEAIDYANPIRFKGDITKAFFIENGANKYIVTRNEIINSSEFYYKDIKLQGDFIELDNDTQKIFAKGNSKMSLESGNKISAESITMDMLTEMANLKNNVVITNTNDKTSGINTKADKALFKNKENVVDLEGNIESYKGKTKIQADKGVYDLINNKMNGKGNILLSLDFETADQMKEKQKREKTLNEKIKKAQSNSVPLQIVNMDVNQIELKKQFEGVSISWKSSNEDFITVDGVVRHPDYKGKDLVINLTATYVCEEVSDKKIYAITVKKSDVKTYLREQMDKELLYIEGKKVMLKPINSGITIKLISSDTKFLDNNGNILVDDLSRLNGFGIKLVYSLEGVNLNKEYRGSYIDSKFKFISLPY